MFEMANNGNCLLVITPICHGRFRQIKSRNTSQEKEVINNIAGQVMSIRTGHLIMCSLMFIDNL